MKNFKIGDRVVLNDNLPDDARVLLAPGDKGVVTNITTFSSCEVATITVEVEGVDAPGCNIVLMPDEVDLDRAQIESVPDRWEHDVLFAMGYRGLA